MGGPKMTFRRSHRKSRRGCSQCKARHVKCDESKGPGCKVCERLELQCSFISNGPSPASQSTSQSRAPSTTPSALQTRSDAPHSFPAGSPHLFGAPEHRAGSFVTEDFALYHHYLWSTAGEVAWLRETSKIWSEVIPGLACRFDFLLHALIAIAAMHKSLAEETSSMLWRQRSSDHMCCALTAGREALSAINQENVNAVFALSCFVNLYYLVDMTHPLNEHEVSKRSKFIRFSRLVRQNAFVPKSCLDEIKRGPLRPLLGVDDCQSRELAYVLTLLERNADRVRSNLSRNGSSDDFACIQDAQGKLLACISKAFSRQSRPDPAAAFQWIVTVEEDLYRLLEQDDERALFLLACWCPLLSVQNSIWLGRGWIADLSAELVEALHAHSPDWETEVLGVQQGIEKASREAAQSPMEE